MFLLSHKKALHLFEDKYRKSEFAKMEADIGRGIRDRFGEVLGELEGLAVRLMELGELAVKLNKAEGPGGGHGAKDFNKVSTKKPKGKGEVVVDSNSTVDDLLGFINEGDKSATITKEAVTTTTSTKKLKLKTPKNG